MSNIQMMLNRADIQAHIHTHIFTHKHTEKVIYTHAHTSTRTNTSILNTRIHTHMHTYTYKYTHIHTQAHIFRCIYTSLVSNLLDSAERGADFAGDRPDDALPTVARDSRLLELSFVLISRNIKAKLKKSSTWLEMIAQSNTSIFWKYTGFQFSHLVFFLEILSCHGHHNTLTTSSYFNYFGKCFHFTPLQRELARTILKEHFQKVDPEGLSSRNEIYY